MKEKAKDVSRTRQTAQMKMHISPIQHNGQNYEIAF
jgi:hypothetical protein